MPDPTNDIDELASFLSKVVECDSMRCDSDDARPWIAALTALIAERNALKQRVAELEAQPPADRDLRERLLESALRGAGRRLGVNPEELGRQAMRIVNATLAAMRKGVGNE